MDIPLADKRENEQTLMVIRKHWYVFLTVIFLGVLFAIFPIIGYFIVQRYVGVSGGLFNILIMLTSLYYMFVATYFFIGWLNYYLDVDIITTERIVSIEQKNLFDREISTLDLVKIQDVKATCVGMLNTFIKLGDVEVQTAGEAPNFFFKRIANPFYVSQKVVEVQKQYIEKIERENPEARKDQVMNGGL